MGIGIVLIFYFIALSIAAVISSGILVALTVWYLGGLQHKPRWIFLLVAAFPFACVAYAGGWFMAYAAIDDIVFHHDPMLGDGWYTDIGNGYAIDMIDVTDQGTVHPTGGSDRGLNDPKGVSGVRRLQVAGTYVFGSQDIHGFEHLGQNSNEESSFFAIDTRSRQVTPFQSESALAAYAAKNGTTLALRPIYDVYSQYRFNWFEPVAGLLLVMLPALAFWWMLRRIYSMKGQSAPASTRTA